MLVIIGVSLLLHVAGYAAMPDVYKNARDSYKVTFTVNRIEPPPPPPEPAPAPPKPKPAPPPKPEEKTLPKANTEAPPSPAPQAPPPPVFGLTADSTADDANSQVAFRVGNTLMKEQEKNLTPPEEVKPYSGGAATPSAPAAPQVVPQFKLSKMPQIKDLVKPRYTEEARRNEIEGRVLLTVTIDSTGKVIEVAVKQGLGYGLDEAAMEAIRKTTFVPGFVGAKAVLTRVTVPIRFVLDE